MLLVLLKQSKFSEDHSLCPSSIRKNSIGLKYNYSIKSWWFGKLWSFNSNDTVAFWCEMSVIACWYLELGVFDFRNSLVKVEKLHMKASYYYY